MDGSRTPARVFWRWGSYFLLATLAIALGMLRWGGYLLVASEDLPAHVDTAVVLQGSVAGEKARIAGAVYLLQRGIARRVLLGVPQQSYWGQSIPPVARRFLEKNYGGEISDHTDFCELGPEVESTEQEAQALTTCISRQGSRLIAVVTSNYHTRRAGLLWRKVLKVEDPSLCVWIYGVADPSFEPRGWGRKRLYAKTWLMEFVKLICARLFG